MEDQKFTAKMGLSTKSALCLVCGLWRAADIKTCPECDKRSDEEMATILGADKNTWEQSIMNYEMLGKRNVQITLVAVALLLIFVIAVSVGKLIEYLR